MTIKPSDDPNRSRRGCEHYDCIGRLECRQDEAASSFAPNATLRDAPDPMYPEGEVFPVSRALFDEDPAAYDPDCTGACLAAGTEDS